MNTTTCPLLTVSSGLENCRPFWLTVIGAAAGTPAASSSAPSDSTIFNFFMASPVESAGASRQVRHDRGRVGARQGVEECEQIDLLRGREAEGLHLRREARPLRKAIVVMVDDGGERGQRPIVHVRGAAIDVAQGRR